MRKLVGFDQCFDEQRRLRVQRWLDNPRRDCLWRNDAQTEYGGLRLDIEYHPRWKWQVIVNEPDGERHFNAPYSGHTTKRKALVAARAQAEEIYRQLEAASIELL